MNLEKSILDDHQAQVVVEIEPERLQAARERAARKLASRGKVPGFRPGKAPYEVIVRYYGEAAVHEQAIDLLVDEIYPEVLQEAGIEPAAAGSLENVEGEAAPKFTFKVPLSPEVKLGQYRSLRAPYAFTAPGAEKLEEALDELRQAYATTETVERAAADGDYVVIDVESDQPELARKEMPVMIRAAAPDAEFPFAGFSRELIGLRAGDTRTVHHAFAEDADRGSLSGTTVDLGITAKTVRSVTLPDLNDEFAKMVGKYASLDALREALSKEIEARARSDYDDKYYADLVDELRKGAEIKYAPQTLEHEAEHVLEDMGRRLAQQGLDLETYFKMRSTDAAKFREEEARPVARKRLERSLILDEVARLEKIEVDNQALDEEFSTTLLDLQGRGLNLGAIRGGKQGQQRVAEAVAVQSASRLMTRRTLERLRDIATGNYTTPAEQGDPTAADTISGDAAKKEKKAPKKSAAAGRAKPGVKKSPLKSNVKK